MTGVQSTLAYYRAGSKVPDGLSSTYSGNKETNTYIQEVDSLLEATDNGEDDTDAEDASRKDPERAKEKEEKQAGWYPS